MFRVKCGRPAAMLAAVFLLAGGTAWAAPDEAITVVAPRKIMHKMVGQTSDGIPIEQVSLSRQVGFADLDLTKPDGAAALTERVASSATASCAELERLYPAELDPPMPSNTTCLKAAVDAAMPQVRAAIQQARR